MITGYLKDTILRSIVIKRKNIQEATISKLFLNPDVLFIIR